MNDWGQSTLTIGAHAEEFQNVGNIRKTVFFDKLMNGGFQFACVDDFDFFAFTADQMVMVVIMIGVDQFVTGDAVAELTTMQDSGFFQALQVAIDGGQIVVFFDESLLNVFSGKRAMVFQQ